MASSGPRSRADVRRAPVTVVQNRSIATLAITTLLKTGSEGSVEKLLKQIGTFMSDIAGAAMCARGALLLLGPLA